MKIENSDTKHIFSVPQILFYPNIDQKSITSVTINIFYQQRLSNFLYTRVKGEYDTCQLNLTLSQTTNFRLFQTERVCKQQ